MTSPKKRGRIVVVDDQRQMADMLADGLVDHGFDALAVSSGKQALSMLELDDVAALVTDLRMPEVDGLEILARSRELAPDRPVIVMTAFGAIDTAIEAMRRGAYHYLTKPFKVEEVAILLQRALEQADVRKEAARLRTALRAHELRTKFVAESAAMRAILDNVQRLGDASTPVLILGETGTGKSLLARALHEGGSRAGAAFVSVNCASIPEQLLESELFGHEKGAFTGAVQSRAGLFVEADGGTLFLDEIAEMSPALQAKLLHVLERGRVRPVGGTRERPVDVRIVSATHRDLPARVREGLFREDLLYRIDVVSLEVPPLRARRADLPLLLDHFFTQAKARHPATLARRFSAEAMNKLLEHRWPGNVRELAHTVERVVVLARSEEIDVADLPPSITRTETARSVDFGAVVPMREMQRRYAAFAYEQLGGHRAKTAERLEIDPKTLSKLLQGDE